MSSTDDGAAVITAADVDALAAGAALLGSGGGGDLGLGRRLLTRALAGRSVPLVTPASLGPEDLVVHVGVIGGPDVLAERLIDPHDLAVAAGAVADSLARQMVAVGCVEVGGMNALTAVLAAAEIGLPLVDGDLMGRAFPSIRMTRLTTWDRRPTPLAVVGPDGDVVLLTEGSPRCTEPILAAVIEAMGGAAALALYPTTGSILKSLGVAGSIRTCRRLGSAFTAEPARSPEQLMDAVGGRVLLRGEALEVRPCRHPVPGALTVVDERAGAIGRVDFVDEFLTVSLDGAPVAATPEVIMALDPVRWMPLRTDQVRVGQPLCVCALPALHRWPDDADLLVGPPAFGITAGA